MQFRSAAAGTGGLQLHAAAARAGRSQAVPDWHTQTPQGVELAADPDAGSAALSDWWQHWQDPLLNQLVQQVLANNPSLASSGISYRLALLQAGVATAGFRPKGNLSTGISASESDNADSTSANAGLNASWEIDLWGSRRAAREQADARVEQSLQELRAAQVSLVAEVVQGLREFAPGAAEPGINHRIHPLASAKL